MQVSVRKKKVQRKKHNLLLVIKENAKMVEERMLGWGAGSVFFKGHNGCYIKVRKEEP